MAHECAEVTCMALSRENEHLCFILKFQQKEKVLQEEMIFFIVKFKVII